MRSGDWGLSRDPYRAVSVDLGFAGLVPDYEDPDRSNPYRPLSAAALPVMQLLMHSKRDTFALEGLRSGGEIEVRRPVPPHSRG
jgi:hypothetical protein